MKAAEVHRAGPDEVRILLDWAREEGWNPGLDDASLFRSVDPAGFFLSSQGQRPVAGISIVRHDHRNAFLGLYLCHPAYRGQGHGWSLWRSALATMGDYSIGLDGVVAQQENYRRSGFVLQYRNIRFAGRATAIRAALACDAGGMTCRPATEEDLPRLQSLDARVHGHERLQLVRQWSLAHPTRQTWLVESGDELLAHATLRRCVDGFKVGPLLASDEPIAARLMSVLAESAGDANLILDVPEPNDKAMALVAKAGMQPVFETARMVRGPAPEPCLPQLFGVTSFELG